MNNFYEKESGIPEELVEKQINDVTKVSQEFPTEDNPELSLVGLRWYYLGEDETHYFLHYDKIVYQTEEGVFVELYMDAIDEGETLVIPTPLFVPYYDYYRMYPVSSKFPVALRSYDEAIEYLH